MDDAVVVKVVSGEPEAVIARGLLESAGIQSISRPTEAIDDPLEDFTEDAGPREILVHPEDVEAAKQLLD